jgi:glycosyltransferase involved in cell wall biosynthesis
MTGCVFHDVDELVEQIQVLLKDDKLREELGRNNRLVMERNHDARKIAKQLADITVQEYPRG